MIANFAKKIMLIIFPLTLLFAKDAEWLRSSNGKWRIPACNLGLKEESDGNGNEVRFGLVVQNAPVRMWFDYFDNTNMIEFKSKFLNGNVPLEYKAKHPTSCVIKKEKYRNKSVTVISDSLERYDLYLFEKDNGVVAVLAWGLTNKTRTLRVNKIRAIIDIFIDNQAALTP